MGWAATEALPAAGSQEVSVWGACCASPPPCLIPQASAWVNVFLWCLLTAWLVIQQRREAPIPLLRRQDPEWSAETEAILGGHPRRS